MPLDIERGVCNFLLRGDDHHPRISGVGLSFSNEIVEMRVFSFEKDKFDAALEAVVLHTVSVAFVHVTGKYHLATSVYQILLNIG